MHYISIIILFLSVVYALFILWCYAGWKKINMQPFSLINYITKVSVIVPARNEEKTIKDCLLNILNQNYPGNLIEVIVIDDYSTDATAEIVSAIIKEFPGRKITLLNNTLTPGENATHLEYKKQAITKAIHNASGELIISTDADCLVNDKWVSSIVECYENENPDMIAGPVCFHHEENVFEQLQTLEFMGLIGIGAGSVSNHHPIMCNGANLAYTKKIFLEVNGFSETNPVASGDDTQLMLKIAKRNPDRIRFLKSRDAIVYTKPMHSAKDLFNQRKRWASKIPFKMSWFTFLIAGIAYLLHAGLLIAIFSCLMNGSQSSHVEILILSMLIKFIPEYIFLYSLGSFFEKKKYLWLLLPAQLYYMIYISVIGVVSFFGSYQWKDRNIKSTIKLQV